MGDVIRIVDWLCKKADAGDAAALEKAKTLGKHYFAVAKRQSDERESAAAFCDACRENRKRRSFMGRLFGLPE